MESLAIVHYLTQAQLDTGAGTNLSGGHIEIIDATTRQPNGVVYKTGAAGIAPEPIVTSGNINTVLQAAGGAGWEKVQVATANFALTKSTTGASRDFHIEAGGTLAPLSTTSWVIPTNNIDQLKIRNFSGVAQTFTVTTGAGQFAGLALTVPEDSNPSDNSYTIPAGSASYTPTLYVTIDNDGWVQAQLVGADVSQAEFNVGLAAKANSLTIENSLLWTPHNLVRAIDIDFEAMPLGAVASITNTGSLAGTVSNTTTTQQPIVITDTVTGRRGASFDGVDDWLESSANWALGTTYGLFAVVRLNSKPTAASFIIGEVFDTDVQFGLELGPSGARVSHFSGGSWQQGASFNYTDGDLVVIIGNYDGANLNTRVFGVDALSTQTNSPAGIANNKVRLGRRWDGTVTAANMANMTLFRVIGKASAFTSAEISALETWTVRHFGLETKITRAHTHVVATTSINGLLSSTDKSKLDGIATSAAALASTGVPIVNGTAALGTALTAAKADHVHPTDTNRAATTVATTSANGLMASTDKTKLDGIATGAEVNIQADWNQVTATADDFIRNKPTVAALESTATPVIDGTATAGTATTASRSDHVHPSDTTKQGTLISGTNIKTVNGTTVLGAGDISLGFKLMSPTDIITNTDLAIYLLADNLPIGAVATWENPGIGGDFTQATVASQPTVEAVVALGNKRAVLFADDFMEATNISLGTAFGLFAVFVPTNVTTNQYILAEIYGGATVEYTFGIQSSVFFVGHFNGAWRQHTVGTPVAATPYIMLAGYDGANISIKLDGGTASTIAQTSNPVLTEPSNIRLGRRWDGTADIFDGHIACVVAKRNAYFSATEIAQLEGWAAWYYNRIAILPAAHLYKTTPPLVPV